VARTWPEQALADSGFVRAVLVRRTDAMTPQTAMQTVIRLTAREVDVLRLLALGCTYSQVSDQLGVSVNTVTTHIKSIYRKLEVRSGRAAVWRALELRLLSAA